MIYYIITLCFLAFLMMYMYFDFIRVYYANKSLENFRELRFKSISFILDNLKEHNNELQEQVIFLETINETITFFDKLKTTFTRFRSVKIIYSNIIFSSYKLKLIQEDKNESLKPFLKDYSDNILLLFKTIPFYRWRLILFLSKTFCKILVVVGLGKVSKFVNSINKLSKIEMNINSDHQCFN